MPITLQQAKPLCTASELELVRWSSLKQARTLTPARLRDKRDRARRLRDKFRDLAQQQAREMRGKGRPRRSRPATDNRGTRMKQQLFQETLDRFEAALRAKEQPVSTPAPTPEARPRAKKARTVKKTGSARPIKSTGSPTRKAGKKTSKKILGKKIAKILKTKSGAKATGKSRTPAPLSAESTRFTALSEQATPRAKSRMLARGGVKRVQAHLSSSGRRNQARRDSR
jgi:hypothetical protein